MFPTLIQRLIGKCRQGQVACIQWDDGCLQETWPGLYYGERGDFNENTANKPAKDWSQDIDHKTMILIWSVTNTSLSPYSNLDYNENNDHLLEF